MKARTMKARHLIVILCVILLSGQAMVTSAQQGQDRIIAGEHLARLWDAINLGMVRLDNSELKALITRRNLSAILIPESQPKGKWIVRKCYKVKTVFDVPDAELSTEDFNQLMRYAKVGVFERAEAVRDAIISNDSKQLENAVTRLTAYLNEQDASEKATLSRFAGALLADIEPASTGLAAYIKEYRSFIEKQTQEKLKLAAHSVNPGRPYIVGADLFPMADLFKVKPGTVQRFTINKNTFRAAWVGRTYIIVLQDSAVSSPVASVDPTGLGLTSMWGSTTAKRESRFAAIF